MVVLLAVWLPVPLKEVLGADLLLTVGAHKVLGVPRSAHGGHHLWRRATVNKGGGFCMQDPPVIISWQHFWKFFYANVKLVYLL